MKNFKRTLALVLAVIMVVGMFASVSAAKNTAWYSEGVRYIEGIGVATIGNTADEKITRDEFVLWVAKIESGNVKDSYWTGAATTSFTDVTEENNQVAIKYSEMRGFIEGNGDGTFAPDKNITLGEAAAVIVRLMRYQSKVESNGANWAWAHMEVANEYCKAFTYDFRNNVGGGIYDYDYELTKGEAAYLLATVMNGLKEQVKYNAYNKPVYKSLTIDGHNLGEMFIGHTSVGAYGDVYYVKSINFDVDGTVKGSVELAPLDGGKSKTLKASEFTSLVRVSLGLTAEAAEDEEEICVQDTVKIGNLVDVTFDEDKDIISLEVNSGSKVVDTHIVQYGMLETDAAARLNWTANSLVTGASNSGVDREATMNGTWSSDLLFTWENIEYNDEKTKVVEATLAFAGEEYDFALSDKGTCDTSDDDYADLKVMRVIGNRVSGPYIYNDLQKLMNLIPTVAEGEVTLIFNDEDNDGTYDTVIIAEAAQNFVVDFYDGTNTVNYNYYYDGYRIDGKTASNKLELLVLAAGRHEVVYTYTFETAVNADSFTNDDGSVEYDYWSPAVREVRKNETLNKQYKNGLIEIEVAKINETAHTVSSVKITYKYPALDSDNDHVINKPIHNTTSGDALYCQNLKDGKACNEWSHYMDHGTAMNPYNKVEVGTIQAGVIEESVLVAVSNKNFFRVKVKLAGGTYQTVYIPVVNEVVAPKDYSIDTVNKASVTVKVDGEDKLFTLGTITCKHSTDSTKDDITVNGFDSLYKEDKLEFTYSINGATAEVDAPWNYNEKLAFAFDAMALTGIEVEDTDAAYASKAAKLVGQYISFMVNEDNVATYCVSGVEAGGEGYLLDVEETDIENMYNVTIATVDENGKVEDVEVYSINATASTMFAGTVDYEKIAAVFNKGNIHTSTDLANGKNEYSIDGKDGKEISNDFVALSLQNKKAYYVDTLLNVDVHTNGTFSYITLGGGNGVAFDRADGIYADNIYLNADAPVVDTDADEWGAITVINGTEQKNKAGSKFYKVEAGKVPSATVTYSGEYYSKPCYFFSDDEDKWVLAINTQTITLTYEFGVDSMVVTTGNIHTLDDTTKLKEAIVASYDAKTGKAKTFNTWVGLKLTTDGKVVAVEVYEVAKHIDSGRETVKDTTTNTDVAKENYYVAGKVVTADDGAISVVYDFRGIDTTYAIKAAKITESINLDDKANVTTDEEKNNGDGWYTFSKASVAEADVIAALNAAAKQIAGVDKTVTTATAITNTKVLANTTATAVKYTAVNGLNVVDETSSISNVTFTAMKAGDTGYIPGSYYFSINNADTVYFDASTKKALGFNASVVDDITDTDTYTTAERKYRVTSTTEVVLLTPTVSGWTVRIMTPAQAAKLDLIVTGISFVDPVVIGTTKSDAYVPYNNKLEALVLVGQEALVETTTEVVDDGKAVGEGEYLVYVPTDAETSLYAPEGSKTIKVISNKSVYAIPSGTEVGSIFYAYDSYSGAELPSIKHEIAAGWYVVESDGEIISYIGSDFAAYDSSKTQETYKISMTDIVVDDGKVTGYTGKGTDKEKSYDISSATLLYKDVNGTLKKVSANDVTFANTSIFTNAMKSTKDALDAAIKNMNTYSVANGYTEATAAKYEAAYDAALVAYNEALAANIDKYFNGNIWDSYEATADKDSDIQGTGAYDVTVYYVDGAAFIIVNTWSVSGDVVTVKSAFN